MFALVLLLAVPAGLQAQKAPDLTKPGVMTGIDTSYNYNLGPTGMRGWLYRDGDNVGDVGRMTEQYPWQILVVTAAAGTPASGIMASNDVILGVSTGAGNVPVPYLPMTPAKASAGRLGPPRQATA